MKITSLTAAIFLLTSYSAAVAQGKVDDESTKIKLAMNNAAHELTSCAAYFLIVSVAMENSSDPETAKKYKAVSDQALGFASKAGEVAGLLEETTAARFENEFLAMSKRIGGNTSNVSILFKDYSELCQRTMENPSGRLVEWVEEINKR